MPTMQRLSKTKSMSARFVFLLSFFPTILFAISTPDLDREVEKLKVKATIEAMVAEDQALRVGSGELLKKGYTFLEVWLHPELQRAVLQVDRANTLRLKAIVRQWGWITISEFGIALSDNAWLLVQHADHDVAFQEESLAMIATALKHKNVAPSNLAYLWDRVKVNRGLPQRYGTQGTCKDKGKWEPNTLENLSRLDEFRTSRGLSSFAEYLKLVTPMCQ